MYSDQGALCFHLGSLIFGQSKDIVLPLTNDQYQTLNIILDYESPYGEKKKQCTTTSRIDGNEKLLNQQKHRLEFVYFIRKGYQSLRDTQTTFTHNQQSVLDSLQSLEEAIKHHSTDDNYLTDLLTDLTGQVKEAFSRFDWFKRWGIHYLPSITRMSSCL